MKTRILLVMEQCNPLWPSVPRVAWHLFDHLRAIADVTLVTHARNRDGLLAHCPGADIHFIEESAAVRRYYSAVSRFTSGGGTNWPLLHMLGYPVFDEFDRKVNDRFADQVRGGEFGAVMATTPILPRYPYRIAKACENTPFILGPVNGGLPFPKGFQSIAAQEFAHFNFIRNFARHLPGYTATYEKADRILCGSHYTRNWLRDTLLLPDWKLTWLPENGVTENFFTRPEPKRENETLRLLFAGRLVPYKGADMLIEALAMARQNSERPMELIIVGEGPQKAELASQVERFQLSTSVQFTGHVAPEKMAAQFHQADLFCFPSIREFGGAVVLEAMAAGLPCVVADHGGIGEFVTADCGVKISPRSRRYLVTQMAQAIETFADRPGMRRAMSENARLRAREFSWEAKAAQILDIIHQTIEARHPSLRLAA